MSDNLVWIKDEVMTLETASGGLWVLASDWADERARAEAAEAEAAKWKARHFRMRDERDKDKIANANLARFSHEWRERAEAAGAEVERLRAHISRMTAAGDAMDGWTSMEHAGAEQARQDWLEVSRAALRNEEGG